MNEAGAGFGDGWVLPGAVGVADDHADGGSGGSAVDEAAAAVDGIAGFIASVGDPDAAFGVDTEVGRVSVKQAAVAGNLPGFAPAVGRGVVAGGPDAVFAVGVDVPDGPHGSVGSEGEVGPELVVGGLGDGGEGAPTAVLEGIEDEIHRVPAVRLRG